MSHIIRLGAKADEFLALQITYSYMNHKDTSFQLRDYSRKEGK